MWATPSKFHYAIDILLNRECKYNSNDLIGKILEQEVTLIDQKLFTPSSNILNTSETALAAGTERCGVKGGSLTKTFDP
jgi:hypothetical protein